DALATACARLEKAEIKSKLIVLLSDGESNTGLIKPEEAIRAAKALGISSYNSMPRRSMSK
ncbi:MAG: VWA domain-containing protein, partial [Nitrospinae bacterium]|nr:VWA domain-containing protein [Nitrospinota bacterium]